ncbi:hypothetical protein [[Micrococcus luteus] ATCC 49442]|uniref:hypothetical protein n=1 Tax=[Micrococcus luteus] ATCC 49442 TaxID=2698727 RepID=UPI0013DBDC46|nr:hypothetical protein [[Micrococcus luteus] ATCC 49442]
MTRFIQIFVLDEESDGSPSMLVTRDLPETATLNKYYRLLNLLTDSEILSGTRLELARENKGSWITFALDDRYVMGLLDKGKPDFWPQGLGLGHLYVARIMTASEADRLITEGRHPLL